MSVVTTAQAEPVVVQRESAVVVMHQGGDTVVVRQPASASVFVVRGVPGPAGSGGGADGAFLVVNRLSELTTEPAKAAARANLGLSVIDGGTFN